jgi:hypothetical protein
MLLRSELSRCHARQAGALLTGLAILWVGAAALAQSRTAALAVTAGDNAVRHSPYPRLRETKKAREYYASAWGVEHLQTALTSSGNLVRFKFRVVDPTRAKPFADHAATPYLYAPRTHAVLQVPTMEKIGQLRQLGTLEPDKDYWMVFSNKGNFVRAGDRVNVIIGSFHAEGLLVE